MGTFDIVSVFKWTQKTETLSLGDNGEFITTKDDADKADEGRGQAGGRGR